MNAIGTTSRSTSSGFTLIEVLMAMLVLTVGLLGLLQSLQMSYRQSLRDRLRDEAVHLAEEQMHDMRNDSYDDIADLKNEITKKVSGGEVQFEVDRVAKFIDPKTRSAKRLRVTVSWTANGERFNHEIFTVRTRRHDEQE